MCSILSIATAITGVLILLHAWLGFSAIEPRSLELLDTIPLTVSVYSREAWGWTEDAFPARISGWFKVAKDNATEMLHWGVVHSVPGCANIHLRRSFLRRSPFASCEKNKHEIIQYNQYVGEWILIKLTAVLVVSWHLLLILRTLSRLRHLTRQRWSEVCSKLKEKLTRRAQRKDDTLRALAVIESTSCRCEHARLFAMYSFPVIVLLLTGMLVSTTASFNPDSSYPILDFDLNHYRIRDFTKEDDYKTGTFQGRSGWWSPLRFSQQLLPLALASAIMFCLHKSESPPTVTALGRANVLFSTVWMWLLCTVNPDYYMSAVCIIWPFRIIQALVFGSPRLTVLLQLGVSFVDVAAYFSHDVNQQCIIEHQHFQTSPDAFTNSGVRDLCSFDLFKYQWLQGYVALQVFLISVCVAIQMSFESVRLSQSLALLQAKRSDRASTLAQSLLSAMCDAVVHLDDKFLIKEPCPKLASLLLRAGVDMVSQSILDVLAPEDKGKVAQTLARVAAEYDEAEMGRGLARKTATVVHANLVDNVCTTFPVQIFVSYLLDESNKGFFIIGIKEDSGDVNAPVAVFRCTSSSSSIPETRQVVAPEQVLYCNSFTTRSSSEASMSVESQSLDECSDSSMVDDICVWVDTSRDQLDFLRVSQAIYSLSDSPYVGNGLCEWLDDKAALNVRRILEQSLRSVWINFKLPGSTSPYKAVVELVKIDDCAEHPSLACLRFSNLRRVRKRPEPTTEVLVNPFDMDMKILERFTYHGNLKDSTRPGKKLKKLLENPELLRQALVNQVIKAATDGQPDTINHLSTFAMSPEQSKRLSPFCATLRVDLLRLRRDDANFWRATLSLEIRLHKQSMHMTKSYGKMRL